MFNSQGADCPRYSQTRRHHWCSRGMAVRTPWRCPRLLAPLLPAGQVARARPRTAARASATGTARRHSPRRSSTNPPTPGRLSTTGTTHALHRATRGCRCSPYRGALHVRCEDHHLQQRLVRASLGPGRAAGRGDARRALCHGIPRCCGESSSRIPGSALDGAGALWLTPEHPGSDSTVTSSIGDHTRNNPTRASGTATT